MDKDWRDFERLVATIESTLAPVGAVVRADDRILNNITGRKRQVDASIRYTIGTVPILITVECRKRKNRQDDIWIEQLVTKKQNLGAAKTIAVTEQGVSEQAIKNARFYGIEIRQISAITEDDMLEWMKISEIQNVVFHPVIEGRSKLALYDKPGEPGGRLHPSVIGLLKTDPGGSQVFVSGSDGKAFSTEDVLNAAIRKGLDIHSGVPLDGTKVRKNVRIDFPKGILSVLTEKGPLDLAQLDLSVDVYTTVVSVPVSEAGFSYTGQDTPTVYGVEAAFELFGNELVYSLIKQEGSDILNVKIVKTGKREIKYERLEGKN